MIGRNEEFQKLNVEFTVAVSKSAFIINMFPSFLHPYVPIFSVVTSPHTNGYVRMFRIIGPVVAQRKKYELANTRILRDEIERRKQCLEIYGNEWAEKPVRIPLFIHFLLPPIIHEVE